MTKKGLFAGTFDPVSLGHLDLIKRAAKLCDHLVVGIQSDPSIDRPEKNRPVMSYIERIIMTLSNVFVDDIILYDTEDDLLNTLSILKPDIRIVGADHKDHDFTGRNMDIRIHFNEREHNWSTTDLRNRISYANSIQSKTRIT